MTDRALKPPRVPEHFEQRALIDWARIMQSRFPALRLLYAVPNGGLRKRGVAGKLKAEGAQSGVPDLVLPHAARGFHGLYLEMKATDGRLTDLQKEFLANVAKEGYCAAVAFGAEQGIDLLKWYIGQTEVRPACLS